jgi:hypothetical protein
MATLDDIRAEITALGERLDAFQVALIQAKRIMASGGLSDIDVRLGLVRAGEFRTGNNKEPGSGFTGVRIGYPPFPYASDFWNLVGVNSDVLQFALNAVDGKAYFGGGADIIDQYGIHVYDAGGKPVFIALSAAETINGEALGAGDVLIGDNSSSKPNLFWDQSAGKFYSRSGVVVGGEITGGTFKQYGAEVRDSDGQTITHDTVSDIQFDTEWADDSGFVDLGASSRRITIPTGMGGEYVIGVWAQWAGNATGMRKIGIEINDGGGWAIKPQLTHAAIPTGTPLHYMSQEAQVSLAAGDYIEMWVHQTSGGNLAVVTHMWVRKVT